MIYWSLQIQNFFPIYFRLWFNNLKHSAHFRTSQLGWKIRNRLSIVHKNVLLRNNKTVLRIEQIAALLIFFSSFILNWMKTHMVFIFLGMLYHSIYIIHAGNLPCNACYSSVYTHMERERKKNREIRLTKVTLYCITLNTECVENHRYIVSRECLEPQYMCECVCASKHYHTHTIAAQKYRKPK